MLNLKSALVGVVLIGLVGCGGNPTSSEKPGGAIASPPSKEVVDNQPLFVDIPQEFEISPDKPLVLSPRLVRGTRLAFNIDSTAVLFTIQDSQGAIVKGSEGDISNKAGAAVFEVKSGGLYKITVTSKKLTKVTIGLKPV